MIVTKRKNKPKNDHRSKRETVALALLTFILVAFFGGLALLASSGTPCIHMNKVKTVHIQNHWTGLSQIAPVNADYDLTMQADGTLTGTATFSITYERLTQKVDIKIPADVVQAFYNRLEVIKLKKDEYVPRQEWTDDYPSLSILVQTKTDTYKIYSKSQGENHVPWGAMVDGDAFTIDSAVPAEALAILEPYLALDVQETMIDEHMK